MQVWDKVDENVFCGYNISVNDIAFFIRARCSMDFDIMSQNFREKAKNEPFNVKLHEKGYLLLCEWLKEDKKAGIRGLKWLADKITANMGMYMRDDVGVARDMFRLYKNTVLACARDDFDCFMLALEANRKPEEQFWRPRRGKLMQICEALQAMEDDELDELFLSCPPRVGKTTLIMMFMLWVLGRNSEKSNLYCSYTALPVSTFYDGLIEVIKDPVTYDYGSIFNGLKLAGTNAKDCTLDLGREKRYHSFTGRPIGGSLNGSCDCYGYIVGDDLVSGIEEALSKERMASLWYKVDNNFITRAKEQCKRLWIGTRWSLVDPEGIRLDLLQNEPKYAGVRWRYINTPALDAEEKSNFEYKFGVGFSTDYYQMRRASFERNNDMASWLAQYMGEPIERDGAVFNPDDLRYYNGVLPDADPDRIFIGLDVAYGGGDATAGPVVYQYGDDLFIADVIYNNGDKRVTQPLIVNKVKQHNVQALFIEATKMTIGYVHEVDAALKEAGIHINVQSTTKHFTGTGKEQRIFDRAPDIRERMIFLESGKRSKEYELFMQNLFAFSINKHGQKDDAPDSLTITLAMAIFAGSNRVEIVKRPF